MKKKIAYILVALLIAVAGIGLGVSAFNNLNSNEPNTEVQGDGNEDNLSDEDLMKKAVAYVKTIYKDVAKETAQDFERIGTVPVGKTKFTVDWTVDVDETIIKVVKQDNGMVTIDINEEIGDETPYILTATISDGKGNKESLTWDHVIPAKLTGSYQEIVDMAYALKNGESLPNVATLQGSVISVNTPWDSGYKNITVTIVVEGREDKPIQCYRLKSGDADASQIEVGDLITVTGTLKNYNGTIEFDAGCTLDANEKGAGTILKQEGTMQEIVDKAYALKPGGMLVGEVTLTGSVTKVNTPYDDGYKNVTVTIVVEGRESKPIMCYRMKGTNAENVKAGDLITVKGTIKNYNGTIEFDAGCIMTDWVKGGGKVTIDTPKPTTSTELGRSLMTGDKVVIYAPAYGKALSVDKVATFYNAGKTVTVKDGKMTGYSSAEVFTVTLNKDGTYTFSNGGKNLGVDPEHTNMVLGAGNDKWEVLELGKGLYHIKNVSRETYIEWYDSKENFSTYYNATDNQFELSFYIVEASPEASKTFTVEEAKATLVEKYKDVEKETASNFERISALSLGASKFTITWTVEPTSAATVVDNGNGTCTIKVAKVTADTEYVLTATIKDANGKTATATWTHVIPVSRSLGNVVIWAPAYNMALSTEKTGYYNVGDDVTYLNGVLYNYSDTSIFEMIDNGDGTYSFVYDGQKLGMADSNSSMNLGDEYANDSWELVPLGNDLYGIKNVGRGNYMEWYATYSNWSTYSSNSPETDDRLCLKIYYISSDEEEVTVTAEDALAVLQEEMADKDFTAEGNYTLSDSVVLGDVTFNVTWESDNILVATIVEGKLVITPSTTSDEEFTLTATVTNVDDATDTVSEDFGPYEVPMVEPEEPETSNGYFEKVTADQEDWSGTYLIVYESENGNKAFKGSKSDPSSMKSNNIFDVTIENNQIAATDEVKAESVIIAKKGDGYTIQLASGLYIGAVSGSNSVTASTSADYVHEISYDSTNDVVNLMHNPGDADRFLHYNNSSNFFRYYKSSSNQQGVTLYKYVEEPRFEKVTADQEDWSGTYLIVYESESGNKAFKGSKSDPSSMKSNNIFDVTIENNQIAATDEVKAESVIIAKKDDGYTIQLASGLYIGAVSGSNSVTASTSADYVHEISYDSTNDVVNLMHNPGDADRFLHYNNSSNFFRYYKSSSNQQGVTLYKLVGESGTGDSGTNTPEEPEVPTAPSNPHEIVEAAYALESGASLPYEATLTGTVSEFKYTYNPNYTTIACWVQISGKEDKPILCYSLTAEDPTTLADIAVGDTITVKGTIMNYSGTIEFNGCTLVEHLTPAEIVDAAYALETGASLVHPTTLTGVVSEFKYTYNPNYTTIACWIQVSGKETSPILCYSLTTADPTDLADIALGDTITVTGTITNYSGTIEFNGCTLLNHVKAETETN